MTVTFRRKPLSLLILAAVHGLGLGLLAAPAQAENLRELYDIARGYDASYLAALSQAQASRARAEQAESLLRPTVGLSSGVSRTQTDTPVSGMRGLNTANVGISAVQPLWNQANSASVDKARKSLDLIEADLSTAEQDLIVRVTQAYFDVLGARDTLATAQANKKAISEQLASARRNFEVGTATITDTREAQARFDLATAQEIAADNDLRSKKIALDQLVGKTGIEPAPLLQPVALPTLAGDEVESWVSKAGEAPSVRKARTAYEIAQLETRRTDAGERPTLDLEGTAGVAHNSGAAANSAGGTGFAKNAKVGLTFKLPLYTGGALQNQVREAVALEEKSRNDLDNARRAVAQATRQVYFGVQSGQAQVSALEAAESSSKLALEATQTGYRVGVRVNLDVLNAQTQLFSTQRDLAKARYDVLVNGLRLRQAAGVLAPQDLDTVNGLLAK
ncbi:TolC family outer membrane protein [Leptothrix discophora]|uniref:TolC family outer membrane protein n=1 Tax=Leptothrix discophora TaxID=89 RepID=A0ABT9G2S9_LEPDI|nr:TolC family outer membrane protein [Leptothrix discophora]MDP4300483.1 TolC family outer membrane protein [Leptothrix discophora]